MQWTDQIRRVKILLVFAAVIIAVASLVLSQTEKADVYQDGGVGRGYAHTQQCR